jgi:hypothetical protein
MLLGPILLAGLLAAGTAQTPPPVAQPDYRFPSGAGLLFFYVKPDKTADFEAVVARLSEVLDKTEDPVRKPQAANWHILRSVEATPDAAIYVFMFVPAVAGADYDPIKVLGEALPTEAQALYERLRDSVIRVERMGLGKIR